MKTAQTLSSMNLQLAALIKINFKNIHASQKFSSTEQGIIFLRRVKIMPLSGYQKEQTVHSTVKNEHKPQPACQLQIQELSLPL